MNAYLAMKVSSIQEKWIKILRFLVKNVNLWPGFAPKSRKCSTARNSRHELQGRKTEQSPFNILAKAPKIPCKKVLSQWDGG